jgi:hypothetical protein
MAVVLLTMVGCARPATVATEAGPRMTAAPPPATADLLPAGTMMQVSLSQPLGTTTAVVGDRFTATVNAPIIAQNGQTVVPQGTMVQGVVTGLSRSDGPNQPAVIRLHFDGITLRGHTYPFAANILEMDVHVADNDTPTLQHAIAGAISGGILGAVLRGDRNSILAGAALGAGAGTAISLGTARADANLPVGTRMTVQTTQHVQIR